MISYQNYAVIVSVVFCVISKILTLLNDYWRENMNKRQPTLTSIPETFENANETPPQKWVPKKKHEVLKAKYKCLKKLFQIYDASVIGILPDAYSGQGDGLRYDEDETVNSRRKKRSNRTKNDACAGTSEISMDNMTSRTESVANTVVAPKSTVHSLSECNDSLRDVKYASTQDSRTNTTVSEEKECECTQTNEPLYHNYESKRPTRFQNFLQRLFGLRRDRERSYSYFNNNHIYALSDNNLYRHGRGEKRRRRGLRFRRLRRLKTAQSEIALREVGSPGILSYVQSVQRNCLHDTTQRQCPIIGCRMIFYGIINYNDHLNLCHFTERKFVCHYCHEGFEKEMDKMVHENEHIGISKLNTNFTSTLPSERSRKSEVVTQTDPERPKGIQEEKLRKILSFFDRIANSDQILHEMKKNGISDSNFSKCSKSGDCKRVLSVEGKRNCFKNDKSKGNFFGGSDATLQRPNENVKCHICGEKFNFRRQLSLHVDLEHRVHNKFSKFHSCAGIVNHSQRPKVLDYISEDGQLSVESVSERDSIFNDLRRNTVSSIPESDTVSQKKTDSSSVISCHRSSNIIYCSSKDSLPKGKVGVSETKTKVSYKWEPGTKIINV